MKFGHEMKEALAQVGYPKEWVEKAIPYGRLKKLINKLSDELNNLGLDTDTLSQLLSPESTQDSGSGVLQYKFDGSFQYDFHGKQSYHESRWTRSGTEYSCSEWSTWQQHLMQGSDCSTGDQTFFKPTLTLWYDEKTGRVADFRISEDTRRHLENVAAKVQGRDTPWGLVVEAGQSTHKPPTDRPGFSKIEIPLKIDNKFFSEIQVNNLLRF